MNDDATLEFTIEPFVPSQPGPHVLASITAAEAEGASVSVGPFGTTATAPRDRIATIAAAVLDAALRNGASRVSLQVSTSDPTQPTTAIADD